MRMISRRLILVLAVIYIVGGILLFCFQKSLIYHPDQQEFSSCPEFDRSEVIAPGGTRAYYKRLSDTVVIVYHGNAGSACDRSFIRDALSRSGVSYLFVEYSGYSGDTTPPSKEAILHDAQNISEFVQRQGFSRVIVFGESLGASVATYHSSIAPVDDLILVSPFYTLGDVAKSRFGLYPIDLLLTENYRSDIWMRQTKARHIVLLHGEADTTIPVSQSRQLSTLVPVDNKELITIPGANHNDMYHFPKVWEMILGVIEKNNQSK